MSAGARLVLGIGITWVAIGLLLAIVMGRRGHNSFGWLVIGILLGPLAVVLALTARGQEALRPARLRPGSRSLGGPGTVDVLVGYDGSPESLAALDAVPELFGERLGRVTVATVVTYGDVKELERKATAGLRELGARPGAGGYELELLHGEPGAALGQFAREGGYELIAVGTRGAGVTKAILGSAASQLSRRSTVPILVVGGR
jgi:nucleotide-binding universal stress UspA family protein